MRNRRVAVLFVALVVAASTRPILRAQSTVGGGQNINVVTGSADQFLGDMFRQRQNEAVIGISSVNPDHMMVAYNDYRTVDFLDDSRSLVPGPAQTLVARLLDFFAAPWRGARKARRERNAEELLASAQAWIGLSFTDNGKNFYSGLLPGHPSGRTVEDIASPLRTYEATSDPVLATTADQFFVGGIAFTPAGSSAGFVARFTDRNNTENGRNIQFDFTKILVTGGADQFVDKPSIAAGPSGRAYAAFVLFDQSSKGLSSVIRFFRSTDAGVTWSSGMTLSAPFTRNQSPAILVDPNNDNIVYVIWRVFQKPDAIFWRKSSDGGVTFSGGAPLPIAMSVRPFDQLPRQLNLTQVPAALPVARSNAYPSGAIDGNGTIHLVLQQYVDPVTGVPASSGVPRITITSSKSATSWTNWQAIDLGAGTGTQFMPSVVAVGEPGPSCAGSTGPRSRVMVQYYDARAGGAGTTTGAGYVAGGGTQFDVRIAQASACTRDSKGNLVFGPSQLMSRYTRSARPPFEIVRTAGYGYTAVNRNYEMFCGGRCSFSGDYIHVSPRVPYVKTAAGWKPTTAAAVDREKLPAAVVLGAWADSRDVQLPTNPPPALATTDPLFIDSLPWSNYQAPHTGNPPDACTNAGSRDQNVYATDYAPAGLFAAAPVTFRVANIPHAYPLYVENRFATKRFFRLTIDPTAFAAFNYEAFKTADPAPRDTTADVAIGPYSTVTGSVVIGPGQAAPVQVTIEQINAIGPGAAVVADGAKTTVTINTAGDADVTTVETHSAVVDPDVKVTKPFTGQLTFPIRMSTDPNATIPTPFSQNPFSQNPFSQNPFSQNPFSQNPFSQNPFSQNPFTQNLAFVDVFDVTDVSFRITNGGDQAAAFSALVNIANAQVARGGHYVFQVFINRIITTPALNGCQPLDVSQNVQISNIANPFTQNPFSQNPFSQNPFSQNPFSQNPFSQNPFSQNDPVADPAASNSSFYLAPARRAGAGGSARLQPESTSNRDVTRVARSNAPELRLARLRPGALTAPSLFGTSLRKQVPAKFLTRTEPTAPQRGAHKHEPVAERVEWSRPAFLQSGATTALDYRGDRPADEVVYVMRVYQITATVPPEQTFQPVQVTLGVVENTPDVIVLPGGGSGFDPAGPIADGAGAAFATELDFIVQPSSSSAGQAIAPPVQVTIHDSFGNLMTNFTGVAVTIAIGVNPAGGVLSGTTTRTTVGGIATFSDLVIDKAGTGYTLIASAPGLTSATSASFDIAPPAVATMGTARVGHTATLLPDGRVLIAGGINAQGSVLATAEIYDPATGTFSLTGQMNVPRAFHTATMLLLSNSFDPQGKVLVAGGGSATAEIYDPLTGTFTLTAGSMRTPRASHTAVLIFDTMLGGFKVLVAGGIVSGTAVDSAELFDPSTGTFAAAGNMSTPRANHRATILNNGVVLITGGSAGASAQTQSTAELWNPATHTFSLTGSLSGSRELHTSTLLLDGRVLVTGGRQGSSSGLMFLSDAQVYDPATGAFTATGSMHSPRTSHAATVRPQDGRVVITGGFNFGELATTEQYDPVSGQFVASNTLATARYLHTSTWLYDGRVLVAGGFSGSAATNSAALVAAPAVDPGPPGFQSTGRMAAGRYAGTATLLATGRALIAGGASRTATLASAELYDSALGAFASTGNLHDSRYLHSATLLTGGKVLVAGGVTVAGRGVFNSLASAEVYDPAAGSFGVTGSLGTSRWGHSSTLLQDGRVLIAGGVNEAGFLQSAEVFDPTTGLFSQTGSMSVGRYGHVATRLPNGKVLIAGGLNSSAEALASAEIYDPATGTFSPAGSMTTPRWFPGGQLLPNGKVLIVGGSDNSVTSSAFATAEIYDPLTGSFSPTGRMHIGMDGPTMTLLDDGTVLVSGGPGYFVSGEFTFYADATGVAELYDPTTGTFTLTGIMNTPRIAQSVVKLTDGSVLFAGGLTNGGNLLLDSAELYRPAPPAGRALSFDGNDFVAIPHSPSLSLSTFTLESWVKIDNPDFFRRPLISKGSNFGNYTLSVLGNQTVATPGTVEFAQITSNGNFSCGGFSANAITFGQWTHVAVTEAGGTVNLYLNGQKTGTCTGAPPPIGNTSALFLGKAVFGGVADASLTGLMDEVRVWNVARTDSDISASYNRVISTPVTGLVGYWKLDESPSDQTVVDSSGSANGGSLGATTAAAADDPARVASTAPIVR